MAEAKVKQIEKKIKEDVEKEVRKRIHKRIYETTFSSAVKFNKEFKNQIVIALTAAFAFLIALSWRNPIQKSVDKLIEKLGLVGKAVYIEYLSALVITLIAVLVLMVISRWKTREE